MESGDEKTSLWQRLIAKRGWWKPFWNAPLAAIFEPLCEEQSVALR